MPNQQLPVSKTLWMHFREKWQYAQKTRPVSFYLLLLIPIVLILGSHLGALRDSPKQFALVLGLLFLFFLAVIWRATADVFDVVRQHMADRRTLYPSTLGESEFLSALSKKVRVGQNKTDSGSDPAP